MMLYRIGGIASAFFALAGIVFTIIAMFRLASTESASIDATNFIALVCFGAAVGNGLIVITSATGVNPKFSIFGISLGALGLAVLLAINYFAS